MRIAKGVSGIVVGLILVYVQLVESRPAPCLSGECLGFNIAWLAIFGLGIYALYRGSRLLFGREQPKAGVHSESSSNSPT
jgi:hypothetical protein